MSEAVTNPADTKAARGFSRVETAWIPMPDGVRLAATLWLPLDAAQTPAPAVLEFLPYRRRDGTAWRDETNYPVFAANGVAGVRVDLRGTGDSDGVYDDEYSETELSDAEAAIAWIAAQPWCDGSVGMMGISWGGFNALQLAYRQPPALKAVISIASTVDRYADDIHYKGGAMLSTQTYWATTMLAFNARPPDAAIRPEDWRARWLERLEALPSPLQVWTRQQRRSAYWRHGSICEDFSQVTAPALVIAGWADGYRNTPWKALAGLGGAARAVTGPWIHKYPHFAVPGPRFDFHRAALGWWRRWLSGDVGAQKQADLQADMQAETQAEPHLLYITEAVRPGAPRAHDPGRWAAIDGDAGAVAAFHLCASGALSPTPGAPAALALRTPQDCGVDGGEYFALGPSDIAADQRGADALSLCFETPPLAEPLDVAGPPRLTLRLSSDAPVATLVARLMDVHPDGTAHRVSWGVLNLTHRGGSESPAPMTPGAAEAISLTLDVAGHRFRAGHKIRLALSTSYFPMILPPPTAATLSLQLDGAAVLSLPTPRLRDVAIPEYDAPVPPAFPTTGAPSAGRQATRDLPSGRTTVLVTSDTGEVAHPENGMIAREQRRGVWSVHPEDPLSITGDETVTVMCRRGGIETEAIATGQIEATASTWIVTSELTALEQGKIVFHRRWRDEIERDLQ